MEIFTTLKKREMEAVLANVRDTRLVMERATPHGTHQTLMRSQHEAAGPIPGTVWKLRVNEELALEYLGDWGGWTRHDMARVSRTHDGRWVIAWSPLFRAVAEAEGLQVDVPAPYYAPAAPKQ